LRKLKLSSVFGVHFFSLERYSATVYLFVITRAYMYRRFKYL